MKKIVVGVGVLGILLACLAVGLAWWSHDHLPLYLQKADQQMTQQQSYLQFDTKLIKRGWFSAQAVSHVKPKSNAPQWFSKPMASWLEHVTIQHQIHYGPLWWHSDPGVGLAHTYSEIILDKQDLSPTPLTLLTMESTLGFTQQLQAQLTGIEGQWRHGEVTLAMQSLLAQLSIHESDDVINLKSQGQWPGYTIQQDKNKMQLENFDFSLDQTMNSSHSVTPTLTARQLAANLQALTFQLPPDQPGRIDNLRFTDQLKNNHQQSQLHIDQIVFANNQVNDFHLGVEGNHTALNHPDLLKQFDRVLQQALKQGPLEGTIDLGWGSLKSHAWRIGTTDWHSQFIANQQQTQFKTELKIAELDSLMMRILGGDDSIKNINLNSDLQFSTENLYQKPSAQAQQPIQWLGQLTAIQHQQPINVQWHMMIPNDIKLANQSSQKLDPRIQAEVKFVLPMALMEKTAFAEQMKSLLVKQCIHQSQGDYQGHLQVVQGQVRLGNRPLKQCGL